MKSIDKKAIDRAVLLLLAAKAKFKIIAEDGTEYGELEAALPKRRKFANPRGTLKDHFYPFIADMTPGDVRTIPAKEFGAERIRSSLAGWIATNWGNGAAITSVDRKANTVEVLRVV